MPRPPRATRAGRTAIRVIASLLALLALAVLFLPLIVSSTTIVHNAEGANCPGSTCRWRSTNSASAGSAPCSWMRSS